MVFLKFFDRLPGRTRQFMTCKSILFLCLFFSLLHYPLQAQDAGDIRISGTYQHTPLAGFIQQVEARYPVRFFFREEWMQPVRVSGKFDSRPLREVLQKIFQDTDLSFIVYRQHQVVLMKSPAAVSAALNAQRSNEKFIVIGDSLRMSAQPAELSGYVRDAGSGEGLVGASLYVEETQQGAATNASGYYTLSLPAGNYHLRIQSVGFEEEERSIRVLSNGSLSLDMFERTSRLEEIVITDRAEDANVSGAQMSATRLDIQKVKKLPAFLGEVDLINSIEMLPGVSVAGEGAAGFNVRGGDVGQNLVLLDGIPIFNPSHLFGFFSAFNADMLQEATLYKGGIPAQYGGRIASVLDVKLKEANLRKVEGSGGVGLVSSRLSVEVPLAKDKSSLLIGGRTTYSDWILNRLRDLQLRQSKAYFYDANARFNYRFNEKHKLSVSSYLSRDYFLYAGENAYGYGNRGVSAQWNFLISPRWFSSLQATYSGFDYDVTDDQDTVSASRLSSGFTIAQVRLGVSYVPSERHQWEGGVEASGYRFAPGSLEPLNENSLLLPETLEREQSAEVAAYLNDVFTLSRKLTLNYGLRYSWYANLGPGQVYQYQEGLPQSSATVTDTVSYAAGEPIATYQGAEPRVSLRYGINGRTSVKVSYNRMRQNMHLISNTTAITPTDIWKLSDRYIRPQIGDQVALGYFRNSLGNAIESSIEVYYKKVDNLVEYKNGAQLLMNDQLEADLLSGTGRAYGIELFIAKNIGRLTGWLAYTYARSLRRVESPYREERINAGTFYPSNFDKPHDLTLVGNYQLTRRVRFGANFTYSSGRPITLPEGSYRLGAITVANFSERNQYRIPPYHRLDISFSVDGNLKRKKAWDNSWTFSLYNLYGRKNPYSVFFVNDQIGRLTAYKLAILGRPFPSVTYNFKF